MAFGIEALLWPLIRKTDHGNYIYMIASMLIYVTPTTTKKKNKPEKNVIKLNFYR